MIGMTACSPVLQKSGRTRHVACPAKLHHVLYKKEDLSPRRLNFDAFCADMTCPIHSKKDWPDDRKFNRSSCGKIRIYKQWDMHRNTDKAFYQVGKQSANPGDKETKRIHLRTPPCMEHANMRLVEMLVRHVQEKAIAAGAVDKVNAAHKRNGISWQITEKKETTDSNGQNQNC